VGNSRTTILNCLVELTSHSFLYVFASIFHFLSFKYFWLCACHQEACKQLSMRTFVVSDSIYALSFCDRTNMYELF
jgi:hypothetical protein